MTKEIIFFNRAYNDMDIQASLMAEFAGDRGWSVRVIGYPCDGYVGAPRNHEAAGWLADFPNVTLETVFDSKDAPSWLRLLHRGEGVLRKFRKTRWGRIAPAALALKILHVGSLETIKHVTTRPMAWLDRAASVWNPDIIVIDEVAVQPGRSQIVDKVLPALTAKGARLYIVQTGQHVYPNAAQDLVDRVMYKPSGAAMNFLPGPLDGKIYKDKFPAEAYQVAGNLRMNRPWMDTLTREVFAPLYRDVAADRKILPEGTVRIVFMLSKMSYGVQGDALKDAIRSLSRIDGAAIAIKPHTRGMKFDLMDLREVPNVVDASAVPSTILIDWADTVLFTGSGIAFHAMLAGKKVGLMKFCQGMETIFDSGAACHVFYKVPDLVAFVRNGGAAVDNPAWLRDTLHAGSADDRIAAKYKAAMTGEGVVHDAHFVRKNT